MGECLWCSLAFSSTNRCESTPNPDGFISQYMDATLSSASCKSLFWIDVNMIRGGADAARCASIREQELGKQGNSTCDLARPTAVAQHADGTRRGHRIDQYFSCSVAI